MLRLALTDVPGWHATIDGRPLALHPYDGVMLQARVPGGTHLIELHYWPATFTLGLVVGALALAGVVLFLAAPALRRGRGRAAGRQVFFEPLSRLSHSACATCPLDVVPSTTE